MTTYVLRSDASQRHQVLKRGDTVTAQQNYQQLAFILSDGQPTVYLDGLGNPVLDTGNITNFQDVDEALQSLGADHVAYGHLTTTVTVWDTDPQAADDKLAADLDCRSTRGALSVGFHRHTSTIPS